ncbi:hypothetical protein D3C86_1904810 [compost metagenome]
MPQLVHIRATCTQYSGGSFVIQQGKQQVLDRHELVALGPGLLEGKIEGDFELAVQHGFTSYPSGGVNRPSRSHRAADAGSLSHID